MYASIREDLYLAAKARAAELRIPLRRLVEMGLELALAGDDSQSSEPSEPSSTQTPPTIWDDEYLGMQAEQPLGSPVELTEEETDRVVRASFGVEPERPAQ